MSTGKVTPEKEAAIHRLVFDEGLSHSKVANLLKISQSTCSRYVKKMKKENYRLPLHDEEFVIDMVEDLMIEVDDISKEQKMEKAFEDAIDILYSAVKAAKKGTTVIDERGMVVPIKTIMDCIEKAGKHAKTMADAAKAARQGLTPETIDYQEMAKLYKTFNKETGEFEYDAKSHMESVLNKAYGKKEEDAS